jgi:hypothetical protein
MHDREQDGARGVRMPMTTEVAKAVYGDKIGGELGTYGLLVAIKPSVEDFAKFKSGELTGFSIDGTGIREPVTEKSVAKHALYTTEVDGHAHTVDVSYGVDAGSSWYTSYQNAAGADAGHSHAVVRNADGTITILADSGHSHDLAADQPAVVVVPQGAVIVVENKAPVAENTNALSAKSTRSPEPAKVNDMKLVVLSEAQHAHYQKLAPADAEAFVGKTSAERDVELQKAKDADPIVYKTASGVEVRKSHGDIALMLAKQADEQSVALAKATEIANTEKSARELVELTKRANDTLGALAGADAVHVDVLRAVESIADATKRDAAIATLKAANAVMKSRSKAPGSGGSETPTSDDPAVMLEALATKIATEQKVDIAKARDLALETTEGGALYGEISKRARLNNRPSA